MLEQVLVVVIDAVVMTKIRGRAARDIYLYTDSHNYDAR